MSWFKKLIATAAPIVGGVFGGPVGGMIGSAVGGLLSNRGNQQQQAQITAANGQGNVQAAQQAADMARFRPVNVSTGLGSTSFQRDAQGNVIGANSNLNPQLTGTMQGALGAAQNYFNGPEAGGNPQQMQQQFFQNYLQGQQPGRMGMFSSLQDRLQGQGLLGLNSNQPSIGGGTQGTNPFYTAMSEGWARADNEAWNNSWNQADTLANNNQTRAINNMNTAMGIDKYGQGLIGLGSDLGQRSQAAAAQGAGWINSAAQGGNNANANVAAAGANQNNAFIQNAINGVGPSITNKIGGWLRGSPTTAQQSLAESYGNIGW